MKVGEYCRTKDGHIEKIIDRYKAPYGYKIVVNEDFKFKHYEHNYIKHIIKSSPNIIDLIEENDLVRIEYYAPSYEERITRIFVVDFKNENDIAFENSHCNLNIFDNEWSKHDIKLNPVIKGIITHEQIDSMEYKVKE